MSGHPSATGRAQDREVRRPKTDVYAACHATNRDTLAAAGGLLGIRIIAFKLPGVPISCRPTVLHSALASDNDGSHAAD